MSKDALKKMLGSLFYIQTIVSCLLILSSSAQENFNTTLRDIEDRVDILVETRVIKGQNADLHEWPWQVSLEYNGHHICGGSLVKSDWVLTAAHCFDQQRYIPAFRVVVGRHTIKGVTQFERRYQVRRVIIHAYYIRTRFINDVALMQLQGSVVLSKQVNVITLPPQNNRIASGSVCYITGWGRTQGHIKHSSAHVLQEAPLTIAPFWHCSLVNNQLNIEVDEKAMICAGGGGKGGCQGDSGGPLACNERGRWILRGVVSWGHAQCSAEKFYTVFARVSSFVDWIRKVEQNAVKGECGGRSGIVCLNGGTQYCYNNIPTCRCRHGFSGTNCQNGPSNSVNRPSQANNVSLQCYACSASSQSNCQLHSVVHKCAWPNNRCAKISLGKAIIKGCTSSTVCSNYCSTLRNCKINCCMGNLCNSSHATRSFGVIIGLCMILSASYNIITRM